MAILKIDHREIGKGCSTHGEKKTVYRVLVGNPK
jgi:hypothetical protein